MNLLPLVLVGLGGALGSIGRFLLSAWAHAQLGSSFPYGTVLVNVLGSFLIVFVHQATSASLISHESRLFLATGVLGGFTTYSTFNYDTLSALELGAYGTAGLNVAVTLLGCLAGSAMALLVGRWWVG